MPRKKKARGRPVEYAMPERIDATPEEIADVVLRAKPPRTWRYMEEAERKRLERQQAGEATTE